MCWRHFVRFLLLMMLDLLSSFYASAMWQQEFLHDRIMLNSQIHAKLIFKNWCQWNSLFLQIFAGYYCPTSADTPKPCPAGKFGKELRSKSPNDCFSCPANTYNDLEAQISCKPCGSSAISTSNSETCECMGKNRIFLKSSGMIRFNWICTYWYCLPSWDDSSKQRYNYSIVTVHHTC